MSSKAGSVVKADEDATLHPSIRRKADLIIDHEGIVVKDRGGRPGRAATDQELREAELVTSDTRWA